MPAEAAWSAPAATPCWFLFGWVATFHVEVLLLAVTPFLARTVPRRVPSLMLLFVVAMPRPAS